MTVHWQEGQRQFLHQNLLNVLSFIQYKIHKASADCIIKQEKI
jgi:hypothetical protein